MAETVKHSTMKGVDAHSITRWEVATSAELPTELVATDLHKVAYVADTTTYLILTAIEPAIVWTPLSYKADNPVVDAEQAGQDITLTFEDGTSFAFTLPTVPDAPNSVMDITVDGNGDLVVTFLDTSTALLDLPSAASYDGNAIE